MENYLNNVKEIVHKFRNANMESASKQVNNALLAGGTDGERFSIICSLLRTYEISNPEIYNLVKAPADEMLSYAESIRYNIAANFDLLEELSK